MLCSVPDSVYDILGFVHPFFAVAHSGMKFSTWDVDNDLLVMNCANTYFGGWWFTKCSLWCPTTINPPWFSLGDATYYFMKHIRMMIKPQ